MLAECYNFSDGSNLFLTSTHWNHWNLILHLFLPIITQGYQVCPHSSHVHEGISWLDMCKVWLLVSLIFICAQVALLHRLIFLICFYSAVALPLFSLFNIGPESLYMVLFSVENAYLTFRHTIRVHIDIRKQWVNAWAKGSHLSSSPLRELRSCNVVRLRQLGCRLCANSPALLPLLNCFPVVVLHWQHTNIMSISGYLATIFSSCSYGQYATVSEVDCTLCLVRVHIGL